MKRLILTLILASAAALTLSAQTASLSGKWQIHSSIAGMETDQTCTLTQTGEDLSGSCNSDRGTVEIAGKAVQKDVSWSYKSEYNGTPLTVKYKGTVDSTPKITGTMSVEEFGVEGEFTATQSK